jgi:hypothetical protein
VPTKLIASRPALPEATACASRMPSSSWARTRRALTRKAAPAGVSATLEQGKAERILELADRLTERRLRHVQPLGGAMEVQLLGDGDELAQQPRLDHRACSCLASPARLAITRCGLRQ